MSDLEKAGFIAKGYKAKMAARKLDERLCDWEIFRRTFGFYCWKKNNKLTAEQLACFEEGFKYDKKPASGTAQGE